MKNCILNIITFIFLLSCCSKENFERSPIDGFGIRKIKNVDTITEDEKNFYMAVVFGTVEELEYFLKLGHSPDVMNYPGIIPWVDTNPLYSSIFNYKKVDLLIAYGADVNKRPYIGLILDTFILSEKYPDRERIEDTNIIYENDAYKIIEKLLQAGANPNFKSCPTPILFPATDKHYSDYFEKNGYYPINDAIKSNLFSIVELLEKNGAIIDESSLESAAEACTKSNNTDMIEYIKNLWNKQQNRTLQNRSAFWQ
jgi:hypothetical protein